jgi:hypothetical protein
MSTTERVIIGGEDFTETDARARKIMFDYLDHMTEERWSKTPMRVLINLVLQADDRRREDEARRPYTRDLESDLMR